MTRGSSSGLLCRLLAFGVWLASGSVLAHPTVVTATGMSFHTAQKMFDALAAIGIVARGDERKYGKFYTYTDYLALLNRDS